MDIDDIIPPIDFFGLESKLLRLFDFVLEEVIREEAKIVIVNEREEDLNDLLRFNEGPFGIVDK